MPSKTDTIALGHHMLKRNVKLLDCQRERIVVMHSEGASINGLARMFKVNKRLVQFIIYPERMQKNKELRAERGGSAIYYKKDYHAQKMREHREYKRKTIKIDNQP